MMASGHRASLVSNSRPSEEGVGGQLISCATRRCASATKLPSHAPCTVWCDLDADERVLPARDRGLAGRHLDAGELSERNLCSVGCGDPDVGDPSSVAGHPRRERTTTSKWRSPSQGVVAVLLDRRLRRRPQRRDAEPVAGDRSRSTTCAPGAAWRIGRPQVGQRAPPRARARCPGRSAACVQIVAEEFDRDLPDHAGDVLSMLSLIGCEK